MQDVTVFQHWLRDSRCTVVLTGAGMSTESGIPDFRSTTGMYTAMPESALSRHTFFVKPQAFFDAYTPMLEDIAKAKPNIGHTILAEWEKRGLVQAVVTQNVDGLHQQAGSQQVWEMHGTALTGTCQNPRCRSVYDMTTLVKRDRSDYRCGCDQPRNLVKPDMVLFSEDVRHIRPVRALMKKADLLLILGTSLTVNPVAQLPELLRPNARIVIVNYTPVSIGGRGERLMIHDSIGKTLTEIEATL